MSITVAQLPIEEPGRAKRLKALTSLTHEGVDRSIMSVASFTSLERYGRFLAIQYLFHKDIEALYGDARLQALFPGLAARSRLALVSADFADLGFATPDADKVAFDSEAVNLPTALGWLYVAEGSNMGAALLRKEAAKLGLSDSYGARHLAPAPEGPAQHWRAFTAVLDGLELTLQEEEMAGQGAIAAFARVQSLIDAQAA